MKIHVVEAELFHADGCTDMTKLTLTFRNFANSPKISVQKIEVCKHLRYDCSTN
jgi:L-cysteine desulfidase